MICFLKRVATKTFSTFNMLLSLFLSFSLPVQATTNYKSVVINSTHPDLLQTDLGTASGLTHTLTGGGTWDSFVTNDILVNYNVANLTTGAGAVSLNNNALTIQNGTFTFNADQAAARVT